MINNYHNTAAWDSWQTELAELKAKLAQKDLAERKDATQDLRDKLAQVLAAEKPVASQTEGLGPRKIPSRLRLFNTVSHI